MKDVTYEVRQAPQSLQPFVRRFVKIVRQDAFTVHCKPTGFTYLFDFYWIGPDGHAVHEGRRIPVATRHSLTGVLERQKVDLSFPNGVGGVSIELMPTSLWRLFGIKGHTLTGLFKPLHQVAPQVAALAARHMNATEDTSMDRLVDDATRFFSALIAAAKPADPIVDSAVDIFEAANGGIQVAEVANQLGISPRHLNRKFHDIVGTTPKLYGQILQFNWAANLLMSGDADTFAALAADAGYYDQSHLSRALQRFVEAGPGKFLESDFPYIRAFICESRDYGPGYVP